MYENYYTLSFGRDSVIEVCSDLFLCEERSSLGHAAMVLGDMVHP